MSRENRFFIESPRKILVRLLKLLPAPQDLCRWNEIIFLQAGSKDWATGTWPCPDVQESGSQQPDHNSVFSVEANFLIK